MSALQLPEIRKQAVLLAKEARLADPSLVRFQWFPDAVQVRLLELSNDMPLLSGSEVEPVFFRPAPEYGMPVLSGVAMIHEDDYDTAKLTFVTQTPQQVVFGALLDAAPFAGGLELFGLHFQACANPLVIAVF